MAVKQPIFTTSDFNFQAALNKQLCAVVDSKGNIIGTGIPTMVKSNLEVVINGSKYVFNSGGKFISGKESDCSIKMAVSQLESLSMGQVGKTNASLIRKIKAGTGDIVYESNEILDKTYEIPINSLNARDQFAVQALRGMLDKIPDPSAVSKNEITHYCEAAYLWASYMMTESSKKRAIITDEQSEQSTTFDEIGVLDSNTEKLLNNLVIALSRTDEKTVTGSGEQAVITYSERVSIPKLMEFLNNYIKDGNSTVGLKDVITALGGIKTAIEAQTVALGEIKNAISNLELSPTINNNIVIPDGNENV